MYLHCKVSEGRCLFVSEAEAGVGPLVYHWLREGVSGQVGSASPEASIASFSLALFPTNKGSKKTRIINILFY